MSGFAYASVVTNDEEARSVSVLADSLRAQGSQFPLVVLHAPTVSSRSIDELESASAKFNFVLEFLENGLISSPSTPIGSSSSSSSCSSSSTNGEPSKLFVFGAPSLWQYELVCFIAPTSVVRGPGMDHIFAKSLLPTGDWIAGTYLCKCDLSSHGGQLSRVRTFSMSGDMMFAPTHAECPYSRVAPRGARSMSIAVATMSRDKPISVKASLDPGLFVFYPGERLWDRVSRAMVAKVDSPSSNGYSPYISSEQRVLLDLFHDKWFALPWTYHAGPGMRHAHPELWKTGNVVCESCGGSDEPEPDDLFTMEE